MTANRFETSRVVSRRSFVKGAAAAAALIPLGGLLSACGGQAQAPEVPADEPAGELTPEPEPEPAPATEPEVSADTPATVAGGVLVAWFSGTGNTEGIAEAIAAHTGADTFEITPAVPYTEADLTYSDSASRTSVERNDPNRNVELVQVTPDGFEAYDTVYLGYPIWWGNASWAIDNFVAGNDFTGKTVIPFCTSGSSPIGSSAQDLAAMAGTGEWLEGRRFAGGTAASEVAAWVDGLGL